MAQEAHQTPHARIRRIGWFIAIWAGSVLALGVLALLFRGLMGLLGLGR